MGLLSRRRKVPRIVKKNKKLGQKKVNIKQLDPHIRVSHPFISCYLLETLELKEKCLREL